MTGPAEQPTARVPDALLDFDENIVFTYKGQLFTGIAYEDDPVHGLSEISYVDGLQEDPARDWYPSGQLKAEVMFHANSRHGHDREYREDGTLAAETIYEHGVRVSSRTLADDGRVMDRWDISEGSPNFARLQRLRAQYG